jgi:hypothetical protein
MNKKSVLEQALLQVETIEEAVKANAKGILASTMKQELNELLKESMEEEDETEVEPEEETTEQVDSEEDETEVEPEEEEEDDMSDEVETSDDDDTTDDNVDDLDNEEPTKGIDDMDSDELETSDDFDSMDDDEDTLDMTGASHDEVLKVFKAMKPEDGIIVKKDGNNVELETGDDDYIIKLDEEEEYDVTSDEEMSEEENEPFKMETSIKSDVHEDDMEDMDDMEDEVVYEIDLDEESYDDEDSEPKEVEATESARTIGNGYHGGIKSKKKYYAGNKREEINEEISKLKKQNAEYKKALVLFKDKLNEVAVFNASLAYTTQVFTEHSTTKQEKLNIMKRFSSISTMNEGKKLYEQISAELKTKKTVTESVVNKISSTPTSSSTEILSESKAYESPQFKRMKELMGKIK